MAPRTSSRTPAAKPAAAKPTATKAAAKPKSAAKAKATTTAAKADKPKSTKAAATKATTTKAAAKPKAAPKAAPKPKAAATKTEAAPKAAAKPKAENAPAAKPAASKKRGRTSDAAEAAEAPAPKKVVKRRRTGKLVNDFPAVPAPQGLSVFIWGTGDMGQFGLGPDELDEKLRPQIHEWFQEQKEEGKIGTGSDNGGVEAIAAGGMHTLAVDELGQLRSWGINDNAALGRISANHPDPANPGETLPAEDFETWPLVIESLKKDGFRPVKVAAGDSVSVAIDSKGALRAWGSFRSNEGILGFDDKTTFQFEPVELDALASVEVVDVACGADHVLALTSDGYVYTWGNWQQDQLGRRVLDRRGKQQGLEPQRLGLRNIVNVAAGQYHSLAVDKDGKVYGWGLNTYKQLGLSGREADLEMVSHPVEITALRPSEHNGAKVIQVAGGEHYSLFLFDNGAVYGVGRCDGYEMGLASDHPEQANLTERRDAVKAEKEAIVTEREAALAAITDDNEAKAAAELSLAEARASSTIKSSEYVETPVLIPFPPIPEEYTVVPELGAYSEEIVNPIAQISAGTRHNLAVSKSGHLYAWGTGLQGQLGLGDAEDAKTPSLVRSKFLRPYDSVNVSAGGQHVVLLAKKRDE